MDQTIEIESPGGLMPNLTIEELTQVVSMVRNHVVARVFEEFDLIENGAQGLAITSAPATVLWLVTNDGF